MCAVDWQSPIEFLPSLTSKARFLSIFVLRISQGILSTLRTFVTRQLTTYHAMNNSISKYLEGQEIYPLFLQGDSALVLQSLPNNSIDCIVTSPPYWGKRQYENGGIGLEETYHEYIEKLMGVIRQLHRVLKNGGSFWLNIGDSYKDKQLLGLPWRIALKNENKCRCGIYP